MPERLARYMFFFVQERIRGRLDFAADFLPTVDVYDDDKFEGSINYGYFFEPRH